MQKGSWFEGSQVRASSEKVSEGTKGSEVAEVLH